MTTNRTRASTGTSTATKKSSGTAGKKAVKKAPGKKVAAKRTAKKSSAAPSGEPSEPSEPSDDASSDGSPAGAPSRERASAPRAEATPKPKAARVARAAVEQLHELIGKDIEGVTGIAATEDGWRVEVEVLEVRRIPSTTDVLAVYEVTLDESGEMEAYHRQSRYVRGDSREG